MLPMKLNKTPACQCNRNRLIIEKLARRLFGRDAKRVGINRQEERSTRGCSLEVGLGEEKGKLSLPCVVHICGYSVRREPN